MVFQFGKFGRRFIIFCVLSQQMCFGEDQCPEIVYSDEIERDQEGNLTFGNLTCTVTIKKGENEVPNEYEWNWKGVMIYLVVAAAVGFLLWILTLLIICCICCCKSKRSHFDKTEQYKGERIRPGPPTGPPSEEAPHPNETRHVTRDTEHSYSADGYLKPASPTVNGTPGGRTYYDPPKLQLNDVDVASEVHSVRSLCLDDELSEDDRKRNRLISSGKGRSTSIAGDFFPMSLNKGVQNDITSSHRSKSDQYLEMRGVAVFPDVLQKLRRPISSKENNYAKDTGVATSPDNLYDIVGEGSL